MKNKLYNIEFGTFYFKPGKAVLSATKSLFSVPSLDDLQQDIRDMPKSNLFFPLEGVEEDSSTYILKYKIDDGFKSLKDIRHEHITVRLAVANKIIEQDVLNTYGCNASIFPGNIWYMPLAAVRYAYRGNKSMPSTGNEPQLLKYKALLLYILIGYSFEKALKQEFNISEKRYPFAVQIINASNTDELAELIHWEYDNAVFKSVQNKKSVRDNRKITVLLSLLCIVSFGLVIGIGFKAKSYQESNIGLNTQLEEKTDQLEQVTAQLTNMSYQNDLDAALADSDFDTAVTVMSEHGDSNQDMAAVFLERGQYNLALQYDASLLEAVIQKLYANSEKENVLKITLDTEDTALSQKLKLEQAIVSNDNSVLENEWVYTEDKYTLTRMAEVLINSGNINLGNEIMGKLQALGYSQENEYISSLLSKMEYETALQNAETSLAEANNLPEDNETRSQSIEEAQNLVNTCSENLSSAENQVNERNTAMKEAWENEIQNN